MERLHIFPVRPGSDPPDSTASRPFDPRGPGGSGGPGGPGGPHLAPGARALASPGAPEPPSDELDLRALVAMLWRGKWIILVTAFVAGVLGALLTTQKTPLYEATAVVMFEAPRANLEAGEAVVASTLTGPINNQLEVLRSAGLMARVVEAAGLIEDPRFNPALRPPPAPTWRDRFVVPDAVTELLVATGLRAPPRPPVPALAPDAAEAQARGAIMRTLQRGIRLDPVPDTYVIRIAYTAPDRHAAALVANTVAEQYIVDQLEGKLETLRAATTWLTARVTELQDRVEAAESAVLAAQAAVSDEVGANLQAVEQQLLALTAARGTARSEASALGARYSRLTVALESGAAIGALPEFRTAPAIAELLTREEALVAEDALRAATLLPGHPARARLAGQLAQTRDSIRTEARRLLEALRLEVTVAREREAQLDAEIAALEAQQRAYSTSSVEIRNLEREAQASRVLYESLLTRLQETNAQEDLQSAEARILTPADVPRSPVNTTQNRTLVLALVAGTLLGIGLVMLRERLNNTYRSPGHLEHQTGQPVLATVPRAGARVKRSDLVESLARKPNSALAESIRNLRTSILLANADAPPKVVMFSSSVPREGKSMTSMLMALTSRQMGRSAIIVDCDLRMPALSKVLQVESDRPGLLSVIDGSASIEEAVYVEPDTGLHVLMTQASERAARINAADVLASEAFRHLIAELSEIYDLVVLDTPPTLVVTDARIVAGLADAAVFCVRWDSTPRDAITEGLRELSSVNARLTGVVMTLVDERRASRYAFDGYSYYKGRYRDYYEA